MWVVKLGGSLLRPGPAPLPAAGAASPAGLLGWLDLLGRLGGGRVAIVPGGGGFADEVRRAQAHWGFDDLAAHNMAVLAMAQTACLLRALAPALQPARSDGEIRQVLRRGQTALWMPLEAMQAQPDASASWDNSADSLALGLARRLNAERLVLVKSCPVDPGLSLAALSRAGIVDALFPTLAADVAFPIEIVHHGELQQLRSLLLGERRLQA